MSITADYVAGASSFVHSVVGSHQEETASSNDQNMDITPSLDHCKVEAMEVVPSTVCGPLTVLPSSDQKVHKLTEDGVLAKKLPFEDFCTELEVSSSVEKGMFGGSLFVKSEVYPLKEMPPLMHCNWDTGKKSSSCGVLEVNAQDDDTLDSGLGDHKTIKVCSSNNKWECCSKKRGKTCVEMYG